MNWVHLTGLEHSLVVFQCEHRLRLQHYYLQRVDFAHIIHAQCDHGIFTWMRVWQKDGLVRFTELISIYLAGKNVATCD